MILMLPERLVLPSTLIEMKGGAASAKMSSLFSPLFPIFLCECYSVNNIKNNKEESNLNTISSEN